MVCDRMRQTRRMLPLLPQGHRNVSSSSDSRFLDQLTPGDLFPTTFLRVFRLLRVFKAESYIGAFSLFDNVVRDNAFFLGMSAVVAVVLWIGFSTLMYFSMRDFQPRIDGEAWSAQFQSIAGAMWPTLLNLVGEYPSGDYSLAGRFVSSCVAIFAIGVFSVPVGVLGAGFSEIFAKQEVFFERSTDVHISHFLF